MGTILERLERATVPLRNLDAELHYEFHPGPAVYDASCRVMSYVPAYTESIDAALTLVPEGSAWTLMRHDNALYYAECGPDSWQSNAPTPALAICIAALKARAAQL